jgi:hypothetical protein
MSKSLKKMKGFFLHASEFQISLVQILRYTCLHHVFYLPSEQGELRPLLLTFLWTVDFVLGKRCKEHLNSTLHQNARELGETNGQFLFNGNRGCFTR